MICVCEKAVCVCKAIYVIWKAYLGASESQKCFFLPHQALILATLGVVRVKSRQWLPWNQTRQTTDVESTQGRKQMCAPTPATRGVVGGCEIFEEFVDEREQVENDFLKIKNAQMCTEGVE